MQRAYAAAATNGAAVPPPNPAAYSHQPGPPPPPPGAPPPPPPPPPALAPPHSDPARAPLHPAVDPAVSSRPGSQSSTSRTPADPSSGPAAGTPALRSPRALAAAAVPVEPAAPPRVRTRLGGLRADPWVRAPSPSLDELAAAARAVHPPVPVRDARSYVGCSDIAEYEKQGKLGEGTFGVVWKGRGLRVRHGDVVALKQIIFHNEGDGMPITSIREIRLLKMLDHPNVVPVVDMAYEPADPTAFVKAATYMVFPYMDHDLAGLLENSSVRLEEPHIKQYAKQLLEGTAYLHRNLILHRDMKAANLLINNDGRLMIADFGLARSIDRPGTLSLTRRRRTRTQMYTSTVVTRWYRPPELLLGERRYHTAIDMWGVGCVLGEMYHRKPIFPGESDFDQAFKIFSYCGMPTAESMPGWSKLPGVEG
ncbi:uncharacterized protein RHOBADRAFT_19042, partial [Rhodotorula graminis WP1]